MQTSETDRAEFRRGLAYGGMVASNAQAQILQATTFPDASLATAVRDVRCAANKLRAAADTLDFAATAFEGAVAALQREGPLC